MTKDNKAQDTPSPVSTNICNGFEAEAGAEVTFTSVTAGCKIEKVGSVWPFCNADGSSFGPPIGPFPLPGNTKIFVNSSLSVGDTVPYNVTQTCTTLVQKAVTIIAGATMKKSA
ncbi:MAG TPA: hypothetical protein VMU61_00205 [Candidatus Aquilonibacter sp.]|nr:hypothetical protein [Candidatus Aquilonibacter sp.]